MKISGLALLALLPHLASASSDERNKIPKVQGEDGMQQTVQEGDILTYQQDIGVYTRPCLVTKVNDSTVEIQEAQVLHGDRNETFNSDCSQTVSFADFPTVLQIASADMINSWVKREIKERSQLNSTNRRRLAGWKPSHDIPRRRY